ncbi:MAG: tRNA (guanosine(46)-N7)-methyltransferase TrmB [Gammaproteobacteria bacterium]|nr:tRNA (guanosine(46)-N7)-methyltransferase TrmB [Gammaproteobacteria bacterium]MBU2478903.1 tRNA (guanosine(46)-N7)-methyltransferase TrmB [Gammaproteobacteria bacterium]
MRNPTMPSSEEKHRHVRSFVRREGRITQSQQRALSELLPRYGLALDGILDLDAIFGRSAPRTLEIGFGNGASLATMAAQAPEQDFLGIEVHRPGVGHLLQDIERQALSNLRVICADAVEVLQQHIPPSSLDRVLLFFPDPWPKKRHHKRRILQASFVELIRERLKPGGHFHMATDWQEYAEQMLEVMDNSAGFTNSAGRGQYAVKPDYRPETKFERRGLKLGHGVWDLVFVRD